MTEDTNSAYNRLWQRAAYNMQQDRDENRLEQSRLRTAGVILAAFVVGKQQQDIPEYVQDAIRAFGPS